ncbi:MAG: sigma-54 dependent transcriptional regulator [Alphaproteobacteria bacterium]|uniref:DNA-binding transcriptional regulator NtrC n=1 Tax=Candidatus Nitrobium versatile TaxID=2884831 RepID=A0A953JDP6_9BACT|nr:sigma-54 dependent transcriptional regulator [Candidatus Nitrobium versatile]
MPRVLIADDDSEVRAVVKAIVEREGLVPLEAEDGLEVLGMLEAGQPDAVLLDLKMPSLDGFAVLEELRRRAPHLPVVILTGHGDVETAVEAIKRGAYDFITKPPDFNKLLITIRRAIERGTLEREIRKSNETLELSLEHLLGRSEEVRPVARQILQVARTDFSLILQGETGTGKSYLAGIIHTISKRAEAPFVRVDIGLMPDTLVESELFGYRKGAFTGAERDKPGYFETARGGTLLIDEVENMTAHVQGKLLSVLESKRIIPLGSTEPVAVDVRIIAASNRNIMQSVEKNTFRDDLFFRLGEFVITLPPLRDRSEDIPLFARKFLAEASLELKKQMQGITDDAIALLMKHSWPGNIRELKNVMRRAVLLSGDGVVCPKDIDIVRKGDGTASMRLPLSLKGAAREAERETIMKTLRQTGNNKAEAARSLRISYRVLLEKIKRYGIH